MAESAEKLLAERRRRIADAYAMKVPDRIPITFNFGYMLARLGGITKQELHDNPEKEQELMEKWASYFQPDGVSGLFRFTFQPGVILGSRQLKCPGYGLGPDEPHQFVEGEYMTADEYDAFLDDPSNFIVRTFMPRVNRRLEGFALLPHLAFGGVFTSAAVLNAPPVRAAMDALFELAAWFAEYGKTMESYARRMEALGFPSETGEGGVFAEAPFDFLGDFLRGMRGIFLDMYRCPEKLLAAQAKVSRFMVETVIQAARATGAKFVFIPLHRGSDGFMSLEQFETFYWPQLKGVMLDFIDAGLKPYPFYEGVWDQRLEYLRELPRGKTAGLFQGSDMLKVKEVVGDVLTIVGGFPVSLLECGTREEVREHTRKMCRALGRNGGFVMGASTVLDEADPELVKVWVDATKEYGAQV